jgi:choline dehydrogenase-like flavoprotein
MSAATADLRADVLVIGSGIMGAAVARLIRDAAPAARIVMVDGGPVIGDAPGRHLHDVDDPALSAHHTKRVTSGIQGLYVGAAVTDTQVTDVAALTPGMVHGATLGEETTAMPAVALSWNVGGMGVHWTAATPWPFGGETFDFGDRAGWARDLRTAQRLLRVDAAALGPTRPGRQVLEVLARRYDAVCAPGRGPQPMPMAIRPDAAGRATWTSPAVIFPAIANADAGFTLLAGWLATSLLVEDTTVGGALIRQVGTEARRRVSAKAVVVCADAIRTPQLLFASGIRPDALGAYLNEHAFVTSRVLMDLDRFGIALDELPRPRPGEVFCDSLWLPHSGESQPFHGQIMNTVYVDEWQRALGYNVGLSLYVPTESRPDNRIEFSDELTDVFGMPRMSVAFSYSDADRELVEQALGEAAHVAPEFGDFDPTTELALLPPGSSLHLTGTVRSGATPDGTNVCAPDGRVWGYNNLFLAGTGVIPTPMVCNVTLTGTITAVRAARATIALLEQAS